MRLAARLSAMSQNSGKDEATSLPKGLEYVTAILNEKADKDSYFVRARDWLSIRRGARGERTPMAPEFQLLFYELLGPFSNRKTETAISDTSYIHIGTERGRQCYIPGI
jgi:hypothetical protein